MDPYATLAWFDLFDWLPSDPSWPQRRKTIWAWRKFRKARRWARVLARVPFVRLIAIGNALGYGNCSPESDIDLVIVTEPRRIWMVRLIIVGLLKWFRQRPGERTRDAICSSFFLTTEALDLEPLQIGSASAASWGISCDAPPDPYLLFWVTQLTVLYDEAGTYAALWRANERWVRQWLPNARPRAVHPRLLISPPPTERRNEGGWARQTIERFLRGYLGDALERWCRRSQERRFSLEVRALANRDTRVVINDRMLKFHTNDRRAEYRDRWLHALSSSAVVRHC